MQCLCCTTLNDKDSDASHLVLLNDKQSGELGGLSAAVIDLALNRHPDASNSKRKKKPEKNIF